ncbi:ribose-phosphate diphosphokinase [bacterium]|nr:ribose-phosphate diphosphokinase [bacterium]
MKPTVLLSTRNYQYLANEILETAAVEALGITRDTFSDGEHYYRMQNDIQHQRVIILGATCSDSDTMELYDLASAAVDLGCSSLHLVVPYFGYSTMERAVKKGEIVTAKNRARLLSYLPKSHRGNHIYLFDLHTEGLPYYFGNGLQSHHIYCKSIIAEACSELAGNDFILASTDAGRAKWVESLANDMQVQAAFVLKRRGGKDQTEVTAINADVEGKMVVIYDDMIRSGSSIISAAEAYKSAGAGKIFVIASHGLFVNNGLDKLQDSGLIEKVVCTNTHHLATKIHSDFLQVKSIAPLIIKNLQL